MLDSPGPSSRGEERHHRHHGAALFFDCIFAIVAVVVPVMNFVGNSVAICPVIIAGAVSVLNIFELEQVLNVVFQHQQIGSVVPMELDATTVVPFDASAQLFAILKHENHRRTVIHLLLIIEALRMSLLRRYALAIRIILVSSMLIIWSPP